MFRRANTTSLNREGRIPLLRGCTKINNDDDTTVTSGTAGFDITEQLPSLGSAGHEEGTCKVCCFYQRQKCHSGKNCPYCHLAHDKPKRPGKKMRDQHKRRREKDAMGDAADDAVVQDDSTDIADPKAEEPIPMIPASPCGHHSSELTAAKSMVLLVSHA